MTAPDPALAKALDHLSMQVNPDNVLAVHKVFRQGADNLQDRLLALRQNTRVGLCGLDPISTDAAAAFGAKINHLLQAHQAHQEELTIAADHLHSIALRYGHSEDEIERSLNGKSL